MDTPFERARAREVWDRGFVPVALAWVLGLGMGGLGMSCQHNYGLAHRRARQDRIVYDPIVIEIDARGAVRRRVPGGDGGGGLGDSDRRIAD